MNGNMLQIDRDGAGGVYAFTDLVTFTATTVNNTDLANMVNARFDSRIGSYKLLSAMGGLSVGNIGLGDKFKLPVKPLVLDLQAISSAATDK